ncbi:hypothetical protein [Curvibacter gracilis]|uniref:hypothetical protein n=1 Tax=Curvibacter gracilis TaxID=230310 RepID=UPI000485705E|nr:hypothetical protein [Curvibacter gracilis]
MSDTRKNAPPKGGANPQTPPARAAQPSADADAQTSQGTPAWAKASVAWPFKAAPSLAQRTRRKP